MRFWDSSAVVPLLVGEATTPWLQALLREDPVMLVWWSAEVECASAVSRLEREGHLSAEKVTSSLGRLDLLAAGWHEVQPLESVRRLSRRLLRVHRLRAADALQLAAAVVAAEDRPGSMAVVSLDERLSDAARREGFQVVAPPPVG